MGNNCCNTEAGFASNNNSLFLLKKENHTLNSMNQLPPRKTAIVVKKMNKLDKLVRKVYEDLPELNLTPEFWFEHNIEGGPYKYSESKDTYEGQFKAGFKEGFGIMVYLDGTYYEGHWKDDLRYGFGRFIAKNGDLYEGEWVDDLKEGKGKEVSLSGAFYKGGWKGDLREGSGAESYADGNCYEGEFGQGLRSGRGVFKMKDGSYYEGEFENDCYHGQGEFEFRASKLERTKN